MVWEARYSRSAWEDLQSLPVAIQGRIAKKINSYLSSKNPMTFAKALVGELSEFYRFRIGDYRVIFSRQRDGELHILNIVRVGHRRDIYA
jgi:mRNA interferase RelE/StbE